MNATLAQSTQPAQRELLVEAALDLWRRDAQGLAGMTAVQMQNAINDATTRITAAPSQLIDDLKTRLIAAGLSADTANAEAARIAARLSTLSSPDDNAIRLILAEALGEPQSTSAVRQTVREWLQTASTPSTIPVVGRLTTNMFDISGTGVLSSPSNMRILHQRFRQMAGDLWDKITLVTKREDVDAYIASKAEYRNATGISGIIDERTGHLYLVLDNATWDTVAHELHHVRFAMRLGKWNVPGQELTHFEQMLMEHLAHLDNFRSGTPGPRLENFLNNVAQRMERYSASLWDTLIRLRALSEAARLADPDYLSLAAVVRAYRRVELADALSFGGIGLDTDKAAEARRLLALWFPTP